MAKHALIRNGSVSEFRNVEPASIPAHKVADDGGPLLRPVVEDDTPTFRPELAQLSTSIVVEKARVLVQHKVVAKPLAVQRVAVKEEARRRILARFPDWKQTNMTARGVDLQDLWRRNAKWTETEQAEADALSAAWAWIKAIRAASDVIEALDAVPDDFDDDKRWPA